MAIKILFPAITDSGNSDEFRIRGIDDAVSIGAEPPLVGVEEVDLEWNLDGVNWRKIISGFLTAATQRNRIIEPGRYRLLKDPTVSATALYLEGKCKLL